MLTAHEEKPEERFRLSNPELYNIIASPLKEPLPIRSAEFGSTSAWPIVEDELASMDENDLSLLEYLLNADAEEMYERLVLPSDFINRYPILLYSLIRGYVERPKNRIKGTILFLLLKKN